MAFKSSSELLFNFLWFKITYVSVIKFLSIQAEILKNASSTIWKFIQINMPGSKHMMNENISKKLKEKHLVKNGTNMQDNIK